MRLGIKMFLQIGTVPGCSQDKPGNGNGNNLGLIIDCKGLVFGTVWEQLGMSWDIPRKILGLVGTNWE